MAGLEKRRRTMAAAPDVAAARARLQDAQAALDLVKQQAAQSEIRAPIGYYGGYVLCTVIFSSAAGKETHRLRPECD